MWRLRQPNARGGAATQQGPASIARLIARHSDTYRLRVLKGNLLTIQGGHYSRVKDYAAALERMAEGFQAIDRTLADRLDAELHDRYPDYRQVVDR